MDPKLQNKLTLVTGSASGIGRSIAQTLHAECARVVVNGRIQKSVGAAITDFGGGYRLIGVPANIGTAERCQYLIAESQKVGPVEILIYNPGIFEPKPFEEINEEDWQRFYEINVLSNAICGRPVQKLRSEVYWFAIGRFAEQS